MIQLENVTKRFYHPNKVVLRDVDLNVEKGEFVCILGSSGVGKSTMLNLVAGLEHASSGKVTVNGETVHGPGKDRVVMFQEAALFPWLTVTENVQFGDKIAGVPVKERQEKAQKYLDMVSLGDYKDYKIDQLSGGMRQRVALARALAMDSEVLLMDEPFSALDIDTKKRLWDEVDRIRRETQKTVLMVTHSVEEAVFLADRIITLSPESGGIRQEYRVELEGNRKEQNEKMQKLVELITNSQNKGN